MDGFTPGESSSVHVDIDLDIVERSTQSPTITASKIGDVFIYGYGLDWDER